MMFRDPSHWPCFHAPPEQRPPDPAPPVAGDVASELDALAERAATESLLLLIVIAHHHGRQHAHSSPPTPEVSRPCPQLESA